MAGGDRVNVPNLKELVESADGMILGVSYSRFPNLNNKDGLVSDDPLPPDQLLTGDEARERLRQMLRHDFGKNHE